MVLRMECRFCLKKSPKPKHNIHELDFKILRIIEEMLKISKEDELPKLICKYCVTKLKTMENFIRQCEESDAYFRNNITFSIKHEPELFLSEFDDLIEINTDTAVELGQVEIQYTVANEESQIQTCNGSEIDNLECSDNEDRLDVGEDNIVEDATNSNIVESNEFNESSSDKTTYSCSHCPAEYEEKNLYDLHIKIHDNKKQYPCHFCPIVFGHRMSRIRHMEKSHKEAWDIKRKKGKSSSELGTVTKQVDEQLLPNVNITKEVLDTPGDNVVEEVTSNDITEPWEEAKSVELAPNSSNKSLDDNVTLKEVRNTMTDIQTHGDVHKCSLCPAKYKNRQQLKMHVKIHNFSTIFTCQYCQIVFGSKSGRYNHQLLYHSGRENLEKGKSYECPDCFWTWDNVTDYKRHLKSHASRLKCHLCPATYKSRKMLKLHLKIHDLKKIYTCEFCQIVFSRASSLNEHVRKWHEDKVLRTTAKKRKEELRSATKQVLACSQCPAVYKKILDFKRHSKVHESDVIFSCYYCEAIFDSKKTHLRHMVRKHHADVKKNKTASYDSPKLCSICGKVYRKGDSYESHVKTHSTETNYQCDICSKTFKTKKAIGRHIPRHSKLRPYSCNICSKSYPEAYLRSRHVKRKHLNVQPTIPCHICNRKFYIQADLKSHLRSHTGEKRFECDICGKGFPILQSLTKHMAFHSDDKPFSCSFCPATFKLTEYVKRHERIHTGERPFKCPICLKGFAQLCNMKSHFKYNHKELDYKEEMKKYKTSLKENSNEIIS